MTLVILTLALVLDRLLGDPSSLWQRVPHPVALFGRVIAFFDRQFNDPRHDEREARTYGILAILALLLASLLVGWFLHRMLRHIEPLGFIIEILIVAVLLAQKSLSDHVAAVAKGLHRD